MRVELTIPGVPVAQPRAKATTFGGHTRMYTPAEKVRPFKQAIQILFAEACQEPPTEKPVIVQITAVFPRPKGMVWKSKPMPRVPHAKKPDSDNLAKSVCDALNQIAWRDDSQCHYLIVQKFIASGDEQPHTRIVISD